MKWLASVIVLIVVVGGVIVYVLYQRTSNSLTVLPSAPTPSVSPSISVSSADIPATTVLAQSMDTPWAIAFLPEGDLLVTERAGKIWKISRDVSVQPKLIATLPQVKEIGEGGLLGISLHPDFEQNPYVYLYYTYNSIGNNTRNRVVRMKYENDTLMSEQVLVDAIPGASNHNGGRLAFGPDGNLYIGTGDAQEPSEAQNTKSVAGKILRVTPEGKSVADNPFGNEVYSYGHRNVQGFAWNAAGELWATEHGRSGALSGLDEINHIQKGKNYGWPEIEGDETRTGMVTSARNSGGSITWAPGGMTFVGDQLFFGGLRGSALYKTSIKDLANITEYFKGEYGRIREVVVGSDDMLYITISNRDGRGSPRDGDDKVIRINPTKL